MCSEATAAPRSMKSRRSRKKTRKPKYLSLRRQLAPPLAPPPTPPVMEASTVSSVQLDLSPLHQDHHERDPHVACLLAPNDDDANGGPSLAALLGSGSSAGAPSEEAPSPPLSASGVWGGDGEGLARRALRGRERWVFRCCSSSASSSSSSEQEASSGIDLLRCAKPHTLSLKLDYEEILTAWSDRGSLFIEGEGSQVVPEIHQNTLFVDVACMGSSSLWRVPDMDERVKDDNQTEGKKAESREASVKRYKEKRRSRLFSKRIRYEVRKLNAEKRPRIKGRFVRRNDDV